MKESFMEKFLHHNPRIFFSLLDHLHEGVIIHHGDTSILYANRAATEILGVSYETITGKTAFDPTWYFIDEAMQTLPVESYPVSRIFATGTNIINQIIGVHLPDGQIRWVDVNATLAAGESGDQVAMIFFSDITDRKNAYEEAALFKKVIETVDTGITISDPSQEDCPLIYVNPAFTTMTGYSPQESLYKNCRFLQGEDREQQGRYEIAESIKNGTSCNIELKNYTKNGKLFHNLLTLSPLKKDGMIQYFVGVQHDITHIKEQEKSLHEKNLYIQLILDSQDELILICDEENVLYTNQKLLDFIGIGTLEDIFENDASISSRFIPKENCFYPVKKTSPENFWVHSIMKLAPSKRVVAMQGTDGETHYFSVVVKDFHTDHHIVTLHDITISVLKEQLLSAKAYHDPLTGAYNRQYFYEYLSKDITLNGVIMLDLDNFKLVNDTYGHDIGDQVLIETVKIIATSIRQEDFLIRWGGEEILILSQNKNPKQLQLMAENIRLKIEAYPMQTVGRMTASLGTAIITGDIEHAIKKADDALYQAKKMGRNRVQYCFV